jgi:hypothetical protein
MKKSICIVLALVFITFTDILAASRQAQPIAPQDNVQLEEKSRIKVLKRGTLVQLRTTNEINSREINVGDIVEMSVHIDIKIENDVVLGTEHFATARVKKVRKAGKFGRGGVIELEATTVRTIDGQLIRLEGGKILQRGNARRTLAWAASIVPTAICLAISPPAAPLFIGFGLFMKGREVTIPEGTLMTARVLDDTKVRA